MFGLENVKSEYRVLVMKITKEDILEKTSWLRLSWGQPKRSPFVSPLVLLVASLASITVHAEIDNSSNLGKVDFPISCSQPAQAEFNRAVALLHHMTYPQAREAFERVARLIRSARWHIGALR